MCISASLGLNSGHKLKKILINVIIKWQTSNFVNIKEQLGSLETLI